MARWAKESDTKVATFLDAWDALDASGRQAVGAADVVCERVGLAPVELLRAVADAGCRVSTYMAQIIAAVSHPLVVEKTIKRALDDNCVDAAKHVEMLHKATGFLPMPKGAETTISIMQNAQANSAQATVVTAPSPEQTIRRLSDRFNQMQKDSVKPAPQPPAPKRALDT